jgi:hypothetical protein
MKTHEFILDREARTAKGVLWRCRFCHMRVSTRQKERESKKPCREAEEEKK